MQKTDRCSAAERAYVHLRSLMFILEPDGRGGEHLTEYIKPQSGIMKEYPELVDCVTSWGG